MGVQTSLGHVGLDPFRYISRNASITGHTVILVLLLRGLHTGVRSDHTHFQEPCSDRQALWQVCSATELSL